ncbi:FAD-binding protein [Bradyrhizobium sp. Gha]|uniref:FAD-binding oxidoreductase n=1 Tax=Bradyrhizobium sp. Gha TaxID=1855318 RepID=UPI0015A5EF5E|nr:FAD-binding protein [Bradyrhizobium sp. Gha]
MKTLLTCTHRGCPFQLSFLLSQQIRSVIGCRKSYPDYARQFLGDYRNAPDIVAWARSEADIVAVYDCAGRVNAAVIPFGGGTSVYGGVEPEVGSTFNGTISLDLTQLDTILEVDKTSRAARIQGRIRLPAMEND